MFLTSELQDIYVLHGKYSISLVILSIAISCCASYTSLSLNQRVKDNSFFNRYFWLFLSSIAMGLGIWSMHFIGMSAFELPISMTYDVFLTVLSIVPAIISSYLAFDVSNRVNLTQKHYIAAGLMMGLGISSMHYIGMAAMKMEAAYLYKPLVFIASILIAIVVSYVALYVFSTLQRFMGNQLIKLITSILIGFAITSMHYTGMSAAVFYTSEPLKHNMHEMHQMDTSFVIIIVTVGIVLLLLISSLTSLLDRYVNYRLNHFDALTLFPNQRQFEKDILTMKIIGSLAIVHIHNLEKYISGHGYAFGDQIIKVVADHIQQLKPDSSTIYRIEVNQFAVFSKENDYRKMKDSMEKIVAILKKPVLVDKQQITIDMVCAITHTDERIEGKVIFSNNMAALQHSSIRDIHEVIEYDPMFHNNSREKQIVGDINRAIATNELYLVYQPKVSSKSFGISGLEALVRWNHPTLGMIPPSEFIPILEDNDKICELTDWVIQEVCNQISQWLENDVPFNQISINIPGSYITSARLLATINQNLLQYKINSKYIELEITETSVIHNIDNAISSVNQYRERGISVA